MPELPEVEVVRAGLEPYVCGAQVISVRVRDDRALTRHPTGRASFISALQGVQVKAAARRGKFLWFPLGGSSAGADALVAHLGMSGQFLLTQPKAQRLRHERIRIVVAHPQRGEHAVVFVDQRTFGSLAIDDLVDAGDGAPAGAGTTEALLPRQVSHIARDICDPAFDRQQFSAQLSRRASVIKRVLLNQNIVSGIGNIYADEALWASGIHPETPACELAGERAYVLVDRLTAVLERACQAGGTSFDQQYRNVNGQAGYFSRHLDVYGRAGQTCSRCAGTIVRVRFMNRSSHLCPQCQPVPSGDGDREVTVIAAPPVA